MSAVGAPILRLSNELLLLVVEELDLDTETRVSVLEMALVSRRFHGLASSVLLQSLEIHFSPRRYESNMYLFDRLQRGAVRNKVHYISVDDYNDEEHFSLAEPIIKALDNTISPAAFQHGYLEQVEALTTLIPELSQLKNICLNIQFGFPLAIIEAVNSHLPNCALELHQLVHSILPPLYWETLKKSRSLSRLELGISGEASEDSETLKIVSSCSKLKTLVLHDVEYGYYYPPRFGKRERDALQNLEKLDLWDFPVRFEHQEEWKQLFNWSRLKVLDIASSQLVCLVPTELSDLEALGIRHNPIPIDNDPSNRIPDVEAVADKLRGCQKLEKLTSVLTNLVNANFLSHIGNSLKRLRLNSVKSPVSVFQVHEIVRFCPQLRGLYVVINFTDAWVREDGWVPEVLAAIADHLHTIEELEVFADSNRWRPELVKRRFIRLSDIWEFLWTRREARRKQNALPAAPRFKLLTVHGIGNLPLRLDKTVRLFHHPVALVAPSARGYFEILSYGQSYEVRLSNRDDEIGSGTAYLVSKSLRKTRQTALNFNVDLDKTELGRWVEGMFSQKVVPGVNVAVVDRPTLRQRTLLEVGFTRTQVAKHSFESEDSSFLS